MLIALFHAILSVRYRMNQVISGIGLNLLATAADPLDAGHLEEQRHLRAGRFH